MTTWAQEMAGALRSAGIEAVMGVPGGGKLFDLVEAIESTGIEFVSMGHEGAATIAAGAWAWRRRGVGCSLSIKGPGVANALAGMVSNYYEQWPVLSLSDSGYSTFAGIRAHKFLDHHTLLRTCTKAYGQSSTDAGVISSLVTIARGEIPGPVHLDLVENGGPTLCHHSVHDVAGSPRTESIGPVLRAVGNSRRAAVVVGSLARRESWQCLLSSLRVPVFTTACAKGVIDETSPWGAGVFTGDGCDLAPEATILREADLVVGIGLRNLELLSPKPFSAPCYLVDITGRATDAFAAAGAATRASRGDVEHVVDALRSQNWGDDLVRACRERVRAYLLHSGWLPGVAIERLHGILWRQTPTLVVDTGNFCVIAEHLWPATGDADYCGSSNGRFMGAGIPMAVGASIAAPASSVVCLAGDGGVRPHIAELRQAVARKLRLLVVLLSDGRYGSIAAGKPDRRGSFLRVPGASWYRAVEELGFRTWQVNDELGFVRAVQDWATDEVPGFIEAMFDEESYAVSTRRLR